MYTLVSEVHFCLGILCVLNKFRGQAHALKMIKLVVGSEGGNERSCGLRIEIALHVIGSVLMCFEVTYFIHIIF